MYHRPNTPAHPSSSLSYSCGSSCYDLKSYIGDFRGIWRRQRGKTSSSVRVQVLLLSNRGGELPHTVLEFYNDTGKNLLGRAGPRFHRPKLTTYTRYSFSFFRLDCESNLSTEVPPLRKCLSRHTHRPVLFPYSSYLNLNPRVTKQPFMT